MALGPATVSNCSCGGLWVLMVMTTGQQETGTMTNNRDNNEQWGQQQTTGTIMMAPSPMSNCSQDGLQMLMAQDMTVTTDHQPTSLTPSVRQRGWSSVGGHIYSGSYMIRQPVVTCMLQSQSCYHQCIPPLCYRGHLKCLYFGDESTIQLTYSLILVALSSCLLSFVSFLYVTSQHSQPLIWSMSQFIVLKLSVLVPTSHSLSSNTSPSLSHSPSLSQYPSQCQLQSPVQPLAQSAPTTQQHFHINQLVSTNMPGPEN